MTATLCELCATADHRVRPALAWYAEGGVRTVDRCEDMAACQARVQDAGGEWPLLSREQAARRYAYPRREP